MPLKIMLFLDLRTDVVLFIGSQKKNG